MTSALGNEVKAAIGETHVVWVTEGPAPSLPADALRVTGGRPHVESRQAAPLTPANTCGVNIQLCPVQPSSSNASFQGRKRESCFYFR